MLLLDGSARKPEEASTDMTSSATYKNILIERAEPGIAIVKINRPAALNALNTETLQELKQALKEEALNEKNTRGDFHWCGRKVVYRRR